MDEADRSAVIIAWVDCASCGRIEKVAQDFNLPEDGATNMELWVWFPCDRCGRDAKLHFRRELKAGALIVAQLVGRELGASSHQTREDSAMLRNPTPERIVYLNRQVLVTRLARAVMQRHGRSISAVDWDNGNISMLPDSAEHTFRFLSGPGTWAVSLRAEWFRDPLDHRGAIEAAVEAAQAIQV